MRTLFALTAISAIALATPAHAEDPSGKMNTQYEATDNGGYKANSSASETDVKGTTRTKDTSEKLDVDSDGDMEKTTDVKTTTDPKGLMNKSTAEVKNKTTIKDGHVKTSHKKTVNGKTVEDTTKEGTPQ